MGMLYHWTRECDLGIAEIKYERKALQGTLKKYIGTVSKLGTLLARGQWRTMEEPMLPVHKNRIECMITVWQSCLMMYMCLSLAKPDFNACA